MVQPRATVSLREKSNLPVFITCVEKEKLPLVCIKSPKRANTPFQQRKLTRNRKGLGNHSSQLDIPNSPNFKCETK